MADYPTGDARSLAAHLAESLFENVLMDILREPSEGETQRWGVSSKVPEQRIVHVALGAGEAGFLASIHVDRVQQTDEGVDCPIVHFSGYDLADSGEPPDLPGNLHSEWYAQYSSPTQWRRLRDRGRR